MMAAGLIFAVSSSGETKLSVLSAEEYAGTTNLCAFGGLSLSPRGDAVAYAIRDGKRVTRDSSLFRLFTDTGAYMRADFCDIVVTNLQTGVTQNVTGGTGSSWGAAWSPDGARLAFYSDRSGTAQLWIWNESNGRMRRAGEMTVRAWLDSPQWRSDNRTVVIPVLPEGVTLQQANTEDRIDNSKSKVTVYSSTPTETKGKQPVQTMAWNQDAYFADLATVDVETGNVQRLVKGQRLATYKLSQSSDAVTLSIYKGFELDNSQQEIFDIVRCRFDSGVCKTLAEKVRLGHSGAEFSIAPGGNAVGFVSSGVRGEGSFGLVGSSLREIKTPAGIRLSGTPLWNREGTAAYVYAQNALWRIQADTGKISNVARFPGSRIRLISGPDPNEFWESGNGKSLLAWNVNNETLREGLREIDLTSGESRVLWEGAQYLAGEAVVSADSSQLIYGAEDPQHPADLWIGGPGAPSKRISKLNPSLEQRAMGASRMVEWRTTRGEKVQGALLLPAGYEPGRRYPLVIEVYGRTGVAVYLNRFGDHNAGVSQLLASRGIAVLKPEAINQIGTPMQAFVGSVMPAINHLDEMGIIDRERVGIIGQSAGGYDVLSLLVQPNQFKAAVIIDGTGDLVASSLIMNSDGSSYGLNINESLLIGASIWQNPLLYIENSPLYYLDRVQTPILIFQGAQDPAIPAFLGEEIFVALRRLGKRAVYAKYADASHVPGGWPYVDRIDYYQRVIDWFDGPLQHPVQPKAKAGPDAP
jgi:dipeptidyl aminopeptidase/acylaminoacyl peptidase